MTDTDCTPGREPRSVAASFQLIACCQISPDVRRWRCLPSGDFIIWHCSRPQCDKWRYLVAMFSGVATQSAARGERQFCRHCPLLSPFLFSSIHSFLHFPLIHPTLYFPPLLPAAKSMEQSLPNQQTSGKQCYSFCVRSASNKPQRNIWSALSYREDVLWEYLQKQLLSRDASANFLGFFRLYIRLPHSCIVKTAKRTVKFLHIEVAPTIPVFFSQISWWNLGRITFNSVANPCEIYDIREKVFASCNNYLHYCCVATFTLTQGQGISRHSPVAIVLPM